MMTRLEMDELSIKALPAGGTRVLNTIYQHPDRVTITSIALENVSLVIIARHGMIARLPMNGTTQKLSQTTDILSALHHFFQGKEPLYLYINLPIVPIPAFVEAMISEVTEKLAAQDALLAVIDDALARRDRTTFLNSTRQLQELNKRPANLDLC